MSEGTNQEKSERGRRVGKKGTLRSLTAAEYAEERGVSLFVKAISPASRQPQRTTNVRTDDITDDQRGSETQ